MRWGDTELKTLVCDVDGVLTDGRYYYGLENGLCFKAFHCNDSVAVRLAKGAGLKVVFVTSGSEASAFISRKRAEELGVLLARYPYGCKEDVLAEEKIDPAAMVYIGDCVDDVPLLEMAAVSFVPAWTLECVAKHATYVLKRRGGEGCLLELLETLGLFNE